MSEVAAQLETLRTRPDLAEAAVTDLTNQIVRMHADSKALAVSVLFNKSSGILALLRSRRDALAPKAKYLALDLVAELVQRGYLSVETAREAQTTCWFFFSHSKELAAVKRSAVNVLVALAEATLIEDTSVETITKRFIQTYVQGEAKIVASVKCSILELFGVLVRYYPQCFTIDKQDPTQLKRRLLNTISSCIRSANPEMELLAGAVLGLSNYMHSQEITEAESAELFDTIRKMITPLENQTRYSVPKAGLTFLRDHASKFRSQICSNRDNIIFLHSCLKEMCAHKNKDISKLGMGAMSSFLKEVTISLSERSLKGIELDIFWYFVKDFVAAVSQHTGDSGYTVLAQAIRGLGMFASPCKMLLFENELKELQGILIKKLSSLSEGSNDAKFAHLSAFLDAFTMLAHELDVIDSDLMSAIERISVSMVVNFPKIRTYYREPMVNSFVELLWELRSHSQLKSYWNRIVKQLYLISCVIQESENESADDFVSEARGPTWKEFVLFWQILFLKTKQVWNPDEVSSFHDTLYDGLMECILDIPHDLNLSVREQSGPDEETREVSIASDTSKLIPENAADFVIFVNYVGLSEAILGKIRTELFRKWVFVAGKRIIEYSSQYPLVSGFYKLLASVLSMCESLGYVSGDDGMEVDASLSESQQLALNLFSKFLEEVLLKMRQFKDDLLVSCLKMVLAAPSEVTSIEDLCLPFVESLKMGLSYTPLAVVALDAIDLWRSKTDVQTMRSAYAKILPALNDYLLLELDDSVSTSTKKLKGSSTATRAKKFKAKSLSDEELDEQTVENLKAIQIRILKLLGSIGDASKFLLWSDESSASLLAWDSERCLKIQIPFKETIVDIYIDEMLPRIVELAEFSPDRKTKVAANELLHALVMVMVGGSQLSGALSRSPYHLIYIKIFPVLLRLAVDLDKVTRELFKPLVSQLVHWFTKNSKFENPETMALLQACLEAVESTSGPLREFGAECVAEFLKWSIKHASDKELENNPMNAKSLFKRIYSLCEHSSAAKRMSAAIIVNRIYVVFRESAILVEIFSFELIYYLLFSLKIADGDSPAIGTITLAKTAIDHVAKIITKSECFAKASKTRRLFPGLETSDLKSLTNWLFHECRHRELQYSYKCIELFDKFASKTVGVAAWIQTLNQKDSNYVIKMIEPADTLSRGFDHSALTLESRTRTRRILSLKMALIMYRYLVDKKAMAPLAIVNSASSHLVPAMLSFLDFIADFKPSMWLGSPSELKSFQATNAFIVLKSFEFVHSSLQRMDDGLALKGVFESSAFCSVLATTVFQPRILGFDISLEETKNELVERMVELITIISAKLKHSVKERASLLAALARQLQSFNFEGTSVEFVAQKSQIYLDALGGLQILDRSKVIAEVFMQYPVSQPSFFRKLLSVGIELSTEMDLGRLRLAGEILSHCLCAEPFQNEAFKTVLRSAHDEIDAKTLIEKNFKYLNQAICFNTKAFAEVLLGGVQNLLVTEVLNGLLDWFTTSKDVLSTEIEEFVKLVISNGPLVEYISSSYRSCGVSVLLKFWVRLLQVSPRIVYRMEGTSSGVVFWDEFFDGFSPKCQLPALHDLFVILPTLSDSHNNARVGVVLGEIVTEKFPLGTESADEIEKLTDYIVAINRLVSAMERSIGDCNIEKALLFHLSRDPNHRFKGVFVDSISRKVSNVSVEVFQELCAFSLKIAFDVKYPPDLRTNASKVLLIPALQFGHVEHLIVFFETNIQQIMSVLSSSPESESDHSILKLFLSTKAICLSVIELAYKRIPAAELHSKNGRILQAFVGPAKKGEKEITVALIKAAMDYKKKIQIESEDLKKYRLAANQEAYNATTACLLATQSISKIDVFNAYCFAEKPVLWENIIDIHTPIFFQTDLERPLLKLGIQEFLNSSVSIPQGQKKYLSTQLLADSSLSQISSLWPTKDRHTTMPSSVIGGSLSMSQNTSQSDILNSPTTTNSVENSGSSFLEIELDSINNNPCMKALICVIQKLPIQNCEEMPVWMKSLQIKAERHDTHINIRIFIAKLIVNITSVFTPFKKYWWKFVLALIRDSDSFGNGFNYFVQDLCLLVMEWGRGVELSSIDDQDLLLKTMRWLIRNCNHHSKAAIRSHIRIIRAFIEQFKKQIIPPVDILYNLLHVKPDPSLPSQKYLNLTGIYVFQAFLANEISPYDTRGMTDRVFAESDLYESLCAILLSSKTREIYGPLAECVGQLLSFLERTNSDLLMSILAKVEDICKKRFLADVKSYVFLVNRISLGFPRLMQSQHKTFLHVFSKLDMDSKGRCLEALLSFADQISDMLIELVALDLHAILCSQDEECQVYALGILAVLAPNLTSPQLQQFLPLAINLFVSHSSDRCRSALFTLVHKIASGHKFKFLEESHQVMVKFSLLSGLADSNKNIQTSLVNYFSDEVFKPLSIFERSFELISKETYSHSHSTWYLPQSEEYFLKYGVHFMLDACKLTPTYEQRLYDRGLPDAQFNDRNVIVDLAWNKSSSMMPLFASTLDNTPMTSLHGDNGGFVRMTQDFVWTPTQNMTPIATRTALSSVASEFESASTLSNPVSTRPGISRSVPRTFISRSYVPRKDNSFFAYDAARKKKESLEVERFKSKAQKRVVTLYRKYREGELPDIEISHKDILGPLQELATLDNDTAQLLFAALLSRLITSMPVSEKCNSEAMSAAIHNIFKTTSIFSVPVLGAFLRTVYDCDALSNSFSAVAVTRAAAGSCNFELGILVLEKLIQGGTVASETKRQKASSRDVKQSTSGWPQLASLYKSLKCFEVYESIYAAHISSSPITKEAIAFELLGDFDSAKERYSEGLSGNLVEANSAEVSLWSIQRLECMNKLGEWSQLASSICEDIGNDLPKLWNEEKRLLLPFFITSHLKLRSGRIRFDGNFAEWSEEDPNPLFNFLNLAKANPVKMNILESTFTAELATISMLTRDFDLAQHYVSLSWKQFISLYVQLNMRTPASKLELLTSLQKIQELDEFLGFIRDAKQRTVQDLDNFFAEWKDRYPSLCDSINVWDDLILGRKWIIHEMGFALAGNETVVAKFRDIASSNDLIYSRRMAEAATSQTLFSVAERWLESSSVDTGAFQPEFMLQYYGFLLAKSEFSRDLAAKLEIVKNLMQHMEYYKKAIQATSDVHQSSFLEVETRLLNSLLSSFWHFASSDSFFSNLGSIKSVTKFFGRKLETKHELLECFLMRSKQSLLNVQKLHLEPESLQKGLLSIGKFVDKTIHAIELDATIQTAFGNLSVSAKLVVNSILRAMALGSSDAIEFFPRLLQLLMEYPSTCEDFTLLIGECPLWMFLRWLPQLTSLLDKPAGTCLLSLITQIANKYPNALRFPFSISCEQYSFSTDTSENAKSIDRIKSLIRSEVFNRLTLELRRLEDPVHIFKDLCERFESLLSSSLPTKRFALKQAFTEFKDICLDSRRTGALTEKFSKVHGAKIAALCGNGDALDEKKLKELVKYTENLKDESVSKPGKNLLKTFSVWLSEYQITNVDVSDEIELPGQYIGDCPPDTSKHVRISSFEAGVLVMSSMRRPKRVIIIGTDEKEYPWLVKGGEDLRLDQRIEQMFSIMNELLLKNAFCSRNRVTLATYKVIPMSTSLGMIEWVEGTKPLKACFSETPQFEKRFVESREALMSFVGMHAKKSKSHTGIVALYDAFLQATTTKAVIENITSIWNKNRESYLRSFFLKLTASPEAFFYIRSEFANSLAALNICSYFLGIGDRHLENFLVDLTSGRILGIDFGHAFGSATEILPVPELMPFRLTDQIEKFLLPLGVPGLMLHPMTSVLSSVQDGKDRILNALNIFVNEPLIEWRKNAMKQLRSQGKSSMSDDSMPDSLTAPKWYPQQKLEIARRKLDGENPAYITADELAFGHEKKRFYKQTLAVVMGEKAENVRARVGKKCSTPREQVECLVDLAMDPNVLGRTYVGWSPFLLINRMNFISGYKKRIPGATLRSISYQEQKLEQPSIGVGRAFGGRIDGGGMVGRDERLCFSAYFSSKAICDWAERGLGLTATSD
ncbi:hypothetical protein BC830DRAFT_1219655 [Chytriomyces sp. MP71]|nr:hypothetical protein BC830DRAFT_1219655 [Chytriomyces sp. MP71]